MTLLDQQFEYLAQCLLIIFLLRWFLLRLYLLFIACKLCNIQLGCALASLLIINEADVLILPLDVFFLLDRKLYEFHFSVNFMQRFKHLLLHDGVKIFQFLLTIYAFCSIISKNWLTLYLKLAIKKCTYGLLFFHGSARCR